MSSPPPAAAAAGRPARRYFAALREHGLLASIVFAIALLAGATTLAAPARFAAEADVLVTPIPSEDSDLGGLGLLSSPVNSVVTAARLVRAPDVSEGVRRRLRIQEGRDDLLEKIEVTPLSQSDVVTITARDRSAQRAALLANTFADVLIERRTAAFQARLDTALRRLDAQRAQAGADASELGRRSATLRAFAGAQDPTLQVLQRAVPPQRAPSRSPLLAAAAFFAALLLGSGAALLFGVLSPRIWGEHDLADELAVLARVPRRRRGSVGAYLRGEGRPPPAAAWEPYRALRARLFSPAGTADLPRSVLIASATGGEGKTTTAAGLAIVIAAAGHDVVLLDGDLREPGACSAFGLAEPERGLVDLLIDDAIAPEDVLVSLDDRFPGLRLLAPGARADEGLDAVQSERVVRILARLRACADVVVIDSPALTQFADAIELADAAELAVLVLRLGHSRHDAYAEARAILASVAVPVAGVVITTRQHERGGQRAARPETRARRPRERPAAPEVPSAGRSG